MVLHLQEIFALGGSVYPMVLITIILFTTNGGTRDVFVYERLPIYATVLICTQLVVLQ